MVAKFYLIFLKICNLSHFIHLENNPKFPVILPKSCWFWFNLLVTFLWYCFSARIFFLSLQLLTPLPMYTSMLFSFITVVVALFPYFSWHCSMHFATFLLLHVKHLQLKIVCASNRAGWSVDSYVLSKNLCDSNMLESEKVSFATH